MHVSNDKYFVHIFALMLLCSSEYFLGLVRSSKYFFNSLTLDLYLKPPLLLYLFFSIHFYFLPHFSFYFIYLSSFYTLPRVLVFPNYAVLANNIFNISNDICSFDFRCWFIWELSRRLKKLNQFYIKWNFDDFWGNDSNTDIISHKCILRNKLWLRTNLRGVERRKVV